MIIEQQIKTILGSEDALLEIPKLSEHGEFSTNIAMKIAKEQKRNPCMIAQEIAGNLDFTGTFIAKAEVAGGGYINFFASDEWYNSILHEVISAGENWGCNDSLKGEIICLEYVSANPTGPMHIGNARGGALGDSLARIMKICGAEVVKEFYLNDAGNQVEKLRLSLEARFKQLQGEDVEFREEWYQGMDIIDHAQHWLDSGHDTLEGIMPYAVEKNTADMERILKAYNIQYDVWFRESHLYNNQSVERTIAALRDNGQVYEKNGAVWLKTDDESKDEVLIRANGIPTYFAADIAYHYNKLMERNFTKAINVWGADHSGHIPRMKAAMKSLGIDPSRLEVITIQLVRLMRDGQVARMSKRKGDTISLGDLIEEIGPDSARFFFNMRNSRSSFDFDLDLAVKQSNENPVFYVQYAHARICSILEQANIMPDKISEIACSDKYHYNSSQERALIKRIAVFPREIITAAQMREPSGITSYVRNLASDFHAFYNVCRVNIEDETIRFARLILIQAVRQTIRNSLNILGVSAPDKMASLESLN
ncbi:MAG: arginine--tRNA ligase [Treponema sp.]|nr:arginine--tRNA ligase [Treponema sp.]